MEATHTVPRSPLPRIAIAVGVTLLIGFLSSLAVMGQVETWYRSVERPWFTPPNWIFGPVWTLLYILMGIAAGLVWNQGIERQDVRRALSFYGVQLVLNALWSILFFGLHTPGLALAEIAVLWVFIILTMIAVARVRKASAWLMLPYICWVSFAAILNFSFYQLNG